MTAEVSKKTGADVRKTAAKSKTSQITKIRTKAKISRIGAKCLMVIGTHKLTQIIQNIKTMTES